MIRIVLPPLGTYLLENTRLDLRIPLLGMIFLPGLLVLKTWADSISLTFAAHPKMLMYHKTEPSKAVAMEICVLNFLHRIGKVLFSRDLVSLPQARQRKIRADLRLTVGELQPGTLPGQASRRTHLAKVLHALHRLLNSLLLSPT